MFFWSLPLSAVLIRAQHGTLLGWGLRALRTSAGAAISAGVGLLERGLGALGVRLEA